MSASIVDQADWRRIFSLAKREAEDRAILTRHLACWIRQHGFAGAALLWDENGALHQQIQVGTADIDGKIPPSWSRIELPGATLAFDGSGTQVDQDPNETALILLAAGVRISELKKQVQQQRFEAKFRGVELEALYDVGLAIASTLDLEELCQEALMRAVSLLDARRGALYLFEDGRYTLTSQFGGVARKDFSADEIDEDKLRRGETTGPSEWIPGAEHLLAVAVEVEDRPRGLLVVADKESRYGVGPFPQTDRRTLGLFANQAAIAIENAKLHKLALEKERLEREMELAADIQKQLLPKMMPQIPGFEVMGWNRPARQAGGDYFDFRHLNNGGWGMVVGDVTGKGVPAALLVSTLHSALHVLLDQMEVGPALIERLNRHIFESSSANKFITMLLASIDIETSRLAYLNAGHNPGLLIRRDGGVDHLSSDGLPLGLMAESDYGVQALTVGHTDLVCIYSDGITECESPAEEEFGLERLISLLQDTRTLPLADIISAIDDATTTFADGLPQGDDQTVVLLRRD